MGSNTNSTQQHEIKMDVAWFLKQRIGFIRNLYHDSTAPFHERIQLIEDEKPPYEPPYSEDGEPAFLAEWLEASDSIQMLGHTCIAMLAGALHVYFETWEHNIGINIPQEIRKPWFKKGWLHGYLRLFTHALNMRFDSSGVNLELLEQLVLARNRAEHPETLIRVTPTHGRQDLEKYPSPFFLTDRERELLVDTDHVDAGSIWIMEPSLHVNANKLEAVLSEVECFATWFDQECFTLRFRHNGEGMNH